MATQGDAKQEQVRRLGGQEVMITRAKEMAPAGGRLHGTQRLGQVYLLVYLT